MIQIWAFPADPIYCERLNPAKRVKDVGHPINLQLLLYNISFIRSAGFNRSHPLEKPKSESF